MSINNFIYDIRILKYKCILAYFHVQLEDAELVTNQGEGQRCVRNEEFVKENVTKIKKRIEEVNCTYNDLIPQIKLNPFLIPYYNTIGATVKKHFTVKNPWVPAFLMLEVFRLFSEKKYNIFPDINFENLQAEFELFEDRKSSQLPLHYKCAEDIFLSIDKKRVFKKKRR